MDENEILNGWGIRADQIIDYLSLVGDSADNIPGVKGIGAKGAVKLLNDFEHESCFTRFLFYKILVLLFGKWFLSKEKRGSCQDFHKYRTEFSFGITPRLHSTRGDISGMYLASNIFWRH